MLVNLLGLKLQNHHRRLRFHHHLGLGLLLHLVNYQEFSKVIFSNILQSLHHQNRVQGHHLQFHRFIQHDYLLTSSLFYVPVHILDFIHSHIPHLHFTGLPLNFHCGHLSSAILPLLLVFLLLLLRLFVSVLLLLVIWRLHLIIFMLQFYLLLLALFLVFNPLIVMPLFYYDDVM